MPKNRGHFRYRQRSFRRSFYEGKKRPYFIFDRNERCKGGAQQQILAIDRKAGFAPVWIGRHGQAATTGPELSSCRV